MEIDRWKLNAQVALIYGVVLFCPAMLGWSIGHAASGFAGMNQTAGSAIGAGVGLAAGAAWAFGGGWKRTKRFKVVERAFGDISRNVNALTVEQARETFLSSLAASNVAETSDATASHQMPACHVDVVSLFQRFDRVALRPPVRSSPSVLLEAGRVRPFENNPNAVTIGREMIDRDRVVVHTPTGRVSVHRPPYKPGDAASLSADALQSSPSVWHYLLNEMGRMEFTIALRKKGMLKELDRLAKTLDAPPVRPGAPASVRTTDSTPAANGTGQPHQ